MATTSNDPRKLSRRQQGLNRLTVALNGVQDRATREALEAVIQYLGEQRSGGIAVDGPVKGLSFEASNGGSLKWMVFKKEIRVRDGIDFTDRTIIRAPGPILGVLGWSQYQGSAVWRVMGTLEAGDACYWDLSSLANHRTVVCRNFDSSNANSMNAVIFYQDDNL